MGSRLAGLPWESLQPSFDAASGFTSVQLQACSFTVVALFGVVVRTSLQADDPNRSCPIKKWTATIWLMLSSLTFVWMIMVSGYRWISCYCADLKKPGTSSSTGLR